MKSLWMLLDIALVMFLSFCGMVACSLFMYAKGWWTMEYIESWCLPGVPLWDIPWQVLLTAIITTVLWFYCGPHNYFVDKFEGRR